MLGPEAAGGFVEGERRHGAGAEVDDHHPPARRIGDGHVGVGVVVDDDVGGLAGEAVGVEGEHRHPAVAPVGHQRRSGPDGWTDTWHGSAPPVGRVAR